MLPLRTGLPLPTWISGAAGDLLHHIAAGPVGVLGVFVPPLLAALGIAMLRVHSLGAVHARVSVGCLERGHEDTQDADGARGDVV